MSELRHDIQWSFCFNLCALYCPEFILNAIQTISFATGAVEHCQPLVDPS